MCKYFLQVFLLSSLIFSATSVLGAELRVTVSGLTPKKGQLYVALHEQAGSFPHDSKASQRKIVEIQQSKQTISFELVSGKYALSAFHDLNGNGKIDLNPLGKPVEGYAVSGKKKGGLMSKPVFSSSLFTVPTTGSEISLKMLY